MNLKTALTICFLGLLTACSQKPANDPSQAPTPDAQEAATGANADAANAFRETEQKLHAAKPAWDPKVPLANYTPIKQDKDGSWVTYLAVAHDSGKLQDKELLDLFSPKYYNEPDAFKKQDLIPTELPPIKDALAAYAKQRYYSMEFGDLSLTVMPSFHLTSGYNFEDRSFKLSNDNSCFSTAYGNRQQVTLSFVDATPALCRLEVKDLEMAKRVEQLRATNQTSMRGKIYFFVDSVDGGNTVKVIPTHMQYDILDKPGATDGGQVVTSVLASSIPSPR